MKHTLKLLYRLFHLPATIADWIRRAHGWVDETINEFFENLPETIDSLGEGFGAKRDETPDQKLEKLIKSFVRRDQMLFGKGDRYTARNLISLADFYRDRHRYFEAEKFYGRGIAVLEAHYESGHPQLNDAYRRFADLLVRYAKDELAESYFVRVAEGKAIECGPDSLEVARVLEELAGIRANLGKVDAAILALTRAVDIREKLAGWRDPRLTAMLPTLSRLHRQAGRDRDAGHLHEKDSAITNLEIMESALGKESWSLLGDLERLARIYGAESKPAVAQGLKDHMELIRLTSKVKGADYPRLPEDLERLGDLHEKRNDGGDLTVAHRYRHRAKNIRQNRREGVRYRPW